MANLGGSPWGKPAATEPAVHVVFLIVSKIHQTLTWTTGSLTCARELFAWERTQWDLILSEGLLWGIQSAHQEAMALDWARAVQGCQLHHQSCHPLDPRG